MILLSLSTFQQSLFVAFDCMQPSNTEKAPVRTQLEELSRLRKHYKGRRLLFAFKVLHLSLRHLVLRSVHKN